MISRNMLRTITILLGPGSDVATRQNKYIYMAKLDGTNVLTVNTDKTEGTNGNAPASQNITIKTSADYSSLTLTTLPDGVYLIQYKSTGAHLPKQNDAYAIANLAGNFGWAAQARNQDFNHMPAAQWVVKKKGTSSIAPISITNREFDDQTHWMFLLMYNYLLLVGKRTSLFISIMEIRIR